MDFDQQLLATVAQSLQAHQVTHCLVGFSGGLDSHVLLHVLSRLQNSLPSHPLLFVRALHINHQISPNAHRWAQHCHAVCADLNLPFVSEVLTLAPKKKESLEACARQQRYDMFKKSLQANEVLLTAHHLQDQAETVLLQLLRGAGPKGLAAMPTIKSLGAHRLLRPLLTEERGTLEAYAKKHQLQWVEDESNAQTRFSRNYIRHTVLPILTQRWPSAARQIARAAQHCASAIDQIDQQLAATWQDFLGANNQRLSIKKLQSVSPAMQRDILRFWVEANHFQLPSTVKLAHIQKNLMCAGLDRSPKMLIGEALLQVYAGEIYIQKNVVMPVLDSRYAFQHTITVPGVGRVVATKPLPLILRFRQGGEVCQLPNRQSHHQLKKLMQMWHIPPWMRGYIPLIYEANQLVAVVGYYIDQNFHSRTGCEFVLEPYNTP